MEVATASVRFCIEVKFARLDCKLHRNPVQNPGDTMCTRPVGDSRTMYLPALGIRLYHFVLETSCTYHNMILNNMIWPQRADQ